PVRVHRCSDSRSTEDSATDGGRKPARNVGPRWYGAAALQEPGRPLSPSNGTHAQIPKARWWRRLPNWLSVAAAAFGVFGGLLVVTNATINVVGWAEDQLYWRNREYATLTSLKA